MDNQETIQQINLTAQNTMLSALGIKITDVGNDYICGKMPVDHRTKQPFGLLHGGASIALAETLGSIGGEMIVNNNETVVGIAINANHLKSVRDGWVIGKAVPIQINKRIHVWEIKITNKEKELICISRLTLAVILKR